MAARNPTSFVAYQKENQLIAGEPIRAARGDDILQDQIFTLDAEALCACVSIPAVATSVGPVGWTTLGTIYVRSKDMCDEAGVVNDEMSHEWNIYASATTTSKYIRMTSTATASSTSTLTVASSTPAWVGSYGTINIKTNGVEDTLVIDAKSVAGVSAVTLYGLCIFALET